MDFIKIYSPPSKAIHIGKSHKPTLKPKLANKYVFAIAEREANKICNNKERIKHESTTKAISNAGKSAKNENNE